MTKTIEHEWKKELAKKSAVKQKTKDKNKT